MQRLLHLGLFACSACTVASGPSVPVEDEAPSSRSDAPLATPPEPEPEPEPEAPEAPAPTPEALSVPHDVPPLDTPCKTRREFAASEVDGAVAFSAKGCNVDADCVRVKTGTDCRGGCPSAILAVHEAAYETLRSSIDERVCSSYRDDGCPYATPGCIEGEVRCVEGSCAFGPA